MIENVPQGIALVAFAKELRHLLRIALLHGVVAVVLGTHGTSDGKQEDDDEERTAVHEDDNVVYDGRRLDTLDEQLLRCGCLI